MWSVIILSLIVITTTTTTTTTTTEESDELVVLTTGKISSSLEDGTSASSESYISIEDIGGIKYKPEWSDLDIRPLPEWYDRAKVGIILHWGLYSVPEYGWRSEWFWNQWAKGKSELINYMQKNYPPGFTYPQFGPMFTAELFDPYKWTDLFVKSGAKYVVLTSKHHDGFRLFPSNRSHWNSLNIGPQRDLVGDLSKTVRKAGLKFGLYYSLYEWYHPMYLEDQKSNFTTHTFRDNVAWPELKQLVNEYKPSVIWSDGDWEAGDVYWNATHFLTWLYKESPIKNEVVVNDGWGNGTHCKHGDFYNCFDGLDPHTLQEHKWENAFTLDEKSWGFRRNISLGDILTMGEIISKIVSTVSCGGNVLLNIAPTKEGTIAPIFQERLLELGKWLDVNGKAIYESSPWLHQNDSITPDVWYTCKKLMFNAISPTAKPNKADKMTSIYAMFLSWPHDNVLKLGSISQKINRTVNRIELLGLKGHKLTWSKKGIVTHIRLPSKAKVNTKYAWTLKFTRV